MKDLSHLVFPPLVPVILAVITGILAGNVSSHTHLSLALLCFAVLAVLFLAGFFYKRWLVFWLCLLAGIWSGYQSFHLHSPKRSSGHVSHFYNDPDIHVVGRIVSFSRKYPHKIRVVLDCKKMVTTDSDTATQTIPASGRLYLNIYGKIQHPLKFHDLIQCPGPIRPIRNFGNPGAFDYQTFLKRQGIYGAVHTGADKIAMVSEKKTLVFIRLVQALENTRNRFYHFTMTRLHHQDSAHVLAALVTGIKHQMPTDIKDLFARSGASHLLAISGLHLGILSVIFFYLFYGSLSYFPRLLISAKARKAAGILTLVPLCLYALFCGFSPSTQRAFIMISLFMVSFLGEKQSHPVNTLAGAGIIILLVDPGALFSISFQLSFTAVLFIISGLGIVGKYQKPHIPGILKYPASICIVTVLAGLGTFPLIARYFNMISMVQIPANLLLIPLIGFICLPLGLVSLLVWPFFPGVSELLLTMAAKLISLCLIFLDWLTELSFAWSHVPSLSVYDLAAVYTAMGAGLCLLSFTRTKPVIMVCTAVMTIAGVYGLQAVPRTGMPADMVITVLDVGQGNAALIQTIEGKNLLVDGGGFPGTSGFDTGRHIVAPFLWQQRIMALDAVILTHPDSDHMNGLVFILENFRIGVLVTNGEKSAHDAFARIMAACDHRQIPVFVPNCKKKHIAYDKTMIAFFQCASVRPGLDPNDNSLVFRLKLHNFSMLFPGDIMKTRERLLAQVVKNHLVASVLLAPHHGSNTSSTKFFLDKIYPESVIVSCGFNNRYKFPHPEVLDRYRQRGIQVFRTDIQGAVIIRSSGNGYTITTHKGG